MQEEAAHGFAGGNLVYSWGRSGQQLAVGRRWARNVRSRRSGCREFTQNVLSFFGVL